MANLIPIKKGTSPIAKEKIIGTSFIISNQKVVASIEKKVIKIDQLLKDSFLIKKKETEIKRKGRERETFEKREGELEKKKPKAVKGFTLPSLPKVGIIDWIKNFILNTFLGIVGVKLVDFLPTLLKILPVIEKVSNFFIDVGGKLLDGLVTFIDWGYKAYDATRGFVKNIFGEGGVKQFDQLSSLLNRFLNLALIAGMIGLGGRGPRMGGPKGGGAKPRPGMGGRPRVTTSGGGRAGGVDVRNPLRQRPQVTTGGKPNFRLPGTGPRITGSGAKGLLSTVRPFLKRIPLPVVGALIDFGLSVALGENPGRAAFRAIGAGLLGAVGAAAGSVVPVAGTFIGGLLGGAAGDAVGGALYDAFFGGKIKSKGGKTVKAAGGGKASKRGRVSRTLTKSRKAKRTLSFTPRRVRPGASIGGADKIQSIFPNPDQPTGFFGWLGGLFGKKPEPVPTKEDKKVQERSVNSQEFLARSNDILGKSNFFGPFFTIAIKTLLGQKPDSLDYKNVGSGLNSWMQNIFKSGPLGFAGGGEVDARQFFRGEDYTNIISKSVEESVSKEVDSTLRDLAKEVSLRGGVGREKSIEKPGNEIPTNEFGATTGGGTADTSMNPYRRAFLDTLAYAEGTANYPNTGYNTMFTGKQFSGYKDHPRKIQVSGRYRSDAAGRYQFLSTTWDGLGLPDFSPSNQDKGALKLLAPHVLQAIDKGDFATAFHGARKTWASLPGAGYGQPEKKMKTLVGYANTRLEKYKKGQIGSPTGPGMSDEGKLGPVSEGVSGGKMRTGPSAYIGGSTAYHIDTKFHKSLGMGNMVSSMDRLANAYSARGRKIEFSNAGVSGEVWNPKASSVEKRSLLQRAIDAHSHSRFMRSEGFLPFDYYNPKKNDNRFGKSVEGSEILLPTFGGKVDVGTKYSGYGKSAEIFSGNKMVAMTGHGDVRYEKGGRTLDGPHMAMIGERGTEYVIDADSYESTEKVAPGLLDILNYNVNDKSSLQKNMPSIIASLTRYASYEDGSSQEIIAVDDEPSYLNSFVMGGGSSLIVSGGGIDNTDYETLEML
jgi:muramidase (phage lysozyme)